MNLFTSLKNAQFVLLLTLGLGALAVQSYKQELWVYIDDGPALYFDKPVADLTPYKHLLTSNQSFCLKGLWYSFIGTDFKSFDRTISLSYDGTGDQLVCGRQTANVWDSLRHQGSNDTSVDSISLYTGSVWSGVKFLVSEESRSGIPAETIQSYAVTGKSSWTVFEGQNFDGLSKCYEGTTGDFISGSGFGPLNTVGSVRKGC